MTAEGLFQHTLHDKKISGGKITFVIASAIGQAFLNKNIKPEDVKDIFQAALE